MTTLQSVRRQIYEWRRELRHRAAHVRARHALPPLPARLEHLAEALERDGAAVTSLAELGAEPRLLAELGQLLEEAPRRESTAKSYIVHASAEAVQSCESVLMWGLGEDLLALCANYIGLPIAYRGVAVRRDIADGQVSGTRLWHRDSEDRRILKAIVYVNDVDTTTGPFEFVPKPYAPATWQVDTYDGSRVDNFESLVAPEHWRACTGRQGTVVVVDTCSVYHRGRLPTGKDRLTAFYCYNSATPPQPENCKAMFDRERFVARTTLTPLQRAAISYEY